MLWSGPFLFASTAFPRGIYFQPLKKLPKQKYMIAGTYHINDIARKIDRDKSTIIRWEQQGLVPVARRDSRGWRYYSHQEAEQLIALIRQSNYFQTSDASASKTNRFKKFTYGAVSAIVVFFVFNLITIGLGGSGTRVFAFTNQTSTMYTTVTAGILNIVSASSSNSFSGVNVSFSSQTSTASLGALRVSDARGSGAGWVVNLSGNDWKSGQDVMQLDYDGTGSNNDLGKMCLIAGSGAVSSIAGQDTTNITRGGTDCFSAGTTQIDIYTASSSNGKGDYWITDFTLQQYIPSNPTSQSYTTTIVLTIT